MAPGVKRLAICLSVFAVAAFSQSSTATITGVVTDPDGGAFAGAFVQLKNTQTAAALNVVGEAGGKYALTSVAAGTYDLSVNVPGMKGYERKGIVVPSRQALQIDALARWS